MSKRTTRVVVLLLAALAVAAVAAAVWWVRPRAAVVVVADPATLRHTTAGTVLGARDAADTWAWRGIPYAAAPLGPLRWRAPRAVRPWTGTRAALQSGPPCMQVDNLIAGLPDTVDGRIVGSEDCLYLNVWSPRSAAALATTASAARRLPVMFWIHGGGNTVGSATPYDTMNLLASQLQVVVVSVNYRLGVFGWFSHAALAATPGADARSAFMPAVMPGFTPDASGDVDASGNYGTLDLIAALRWVHDNAAAFGGDAAKVTIFGESAGGMNVFSLLAAPAARGLFQRAIVQSGLPVSEPVQGARASRRNGPPPPAAVAFAPRELDRPYGSHDLVSRLLLNASRVATPDAADALQASLPPRELAQWLRALPAGDVLAPFGWTDGAVKTFAALYPWPAPIADGVVLPSEPLLQVFADPARYNAVPIILGTNRDEAKLFLSVDPLYVDLWFGRLPRLRDAARYDRDAAYASDFWRAIGADEPATRMRAASGPNVYVYRLDWDDTLQNPVIDLARIFGAAHGLDIPLLFGADNAFSRPFLPANGAARRDRDRLAAAMKSYWGAFAHDGAPGRGQGGTLPEWTPWPATPGTAGDALVFDAPTGGGLRMVPGRLTPAGLEQRLLADPTLAADLAERCRLHASMFQLIGGAAGLWDPAHHASLGCTK